MNLLDDALPVDLEREGGLTEKLTVRILRLAQQGVAAGASGVLFTCSAFGDAIDAAARVLPVPVLKPNEAMFAAALRSGRRIGMVATFPPAVEPMAREFYAMAAAQGLAATLETICVPNAMVAARAGDVFRHDELVAHVAHRLAHCDAVMLAHFSTSTALDAVQALLACPVLSAPDAAVDTMRRLCTAGPES